MRAPRFWYPARKRGMPFMAQLLSPLGAFYGLAARIRNKTARPEHVRVPVICIGNVTMGGAGKTPIALAIAERLIEQGEKVHFLSRGYRRTSQGTVRVDPAAHTVAEVGDEPLLLARLAPTWVSADRVAGAKAAADAGASVIIMDDGFQNPYLAKDFSVLVIDAGVGTGNGHVFPAGPLREEAGDALNRAQAVILTGRGHAGDGLAARAMARGTPVYRSIAKPVPQEPSFAGAQVLAFSGIGRPEKFYETLRGLGADIVATQDFPDHHAFTDREASRLMVRAHECDAHLVTTEKDAIRLARAPAGSARAKLSKSLRTVPIRAVIADMAQLETLIAEALRRHRLARGEAG
ncbi:tetraacyldisaccharide 4'-kinase [Parvibaculum sp. MBR-TMA-1.3b-4.2]